MYFADLSSYAYSKDGGAPISAEIPPALSIGWLDDAHAYPQAEPSPELVARLWAFCRTPINTMLGFHECAFRNDNPKTYLEIEKDGQKVPSSALKSGQYVVVDALGDDLFGTDATLIKLVPAPAKKPSGK